MSSTIENETQRAPVEPGDYGVVYVIGGPLKGKLVYYDDDNDGGRAICYLGYPLRSESRGVSFKFLREATKEETLAFELEYMNDISTRKAWDPSNAVPVSAPELKASEGGSTLYVGCFSFHQKHLGKEDDEGSFQIFAEANNPETAVDAFKLHLDHVHAHGDVLSGGDITIYLDSILEVRPPFIGSVLVNFESRKAPAGAHGSIHCPVADSTEAVVSYGWGDSENQRPTDEEGVTIEFAHYSDEVPNGPKGPKRGKGRKPPTRH